MNRHDIIDTILRHADKKRFPSVLITFHESNIEAPDIEAAGVRNVRIRYSGRLSVPSAIVRTIAVCRSLEVRLIHTHHFVEALIGAIAGKLLGIPVIVGRHYDDELHLRLRGLRRRKALAIEAIPLALASVIQVASNGTKETLMRQGIRPDRILVIPHGFDLEAPRYRRVTEDERGVLRKEFGYDDSSFVIGMFARFDSIKGHSLLVRAFESVVERVPTARLLLVGAGPLRDAIEADAKRRGLAHHVIFAGWRTDASRLTAVADVVAHPALSEGFCQIMVESWAQERALVIADSAGPRDHVTPNVNGILVPRGDWRSLADSIVSLASDPARRTALGEAGGRYVRQSLGYERAVAAYEDLYDQLLSR